MNAFGCIFILWFGLLRRVGDDFGIRHLFRYVSLTDGSFGLVHIAVVIR